jgi:hypothetical protein
VYNKHLKKTVVMQEPGWAVGDDCTETESHNLCGHLYSEWKPAQDCNFEYELTWIVSDNCKEVTFTLKATRDATGGDPPGTATTTKTVPRDWIGSYFEMDDAWYKLMNTFNPTGYPSPIKKVRIRSCLTTTTLSGCDDEESDPPPCESCWPACFPCGDELDNFSFLFSILDRDECCLRGAVELGYHAGDYFRWTGEAGGPDGFCATLLEVKVSCGGSEDELDLYVKYRNEDGTVVEINETVDVTCDEEGGFESSEIDVPSGVLLPGICSRGLGNGAALVLSSGFL